MVVLDKTKALKEVLKESCLALGGKITKEEENYIRCVIKDKVFLEYTILALEDPREPEKVRLTIWHDEDLTDLEFPAKGIYIYIPGLPQEKERKFNELFRELQF